MVGSGEGASPSLVKVWAPLINFGILVSILCILVHLEGYEGYTSPQNMTK